MASDSGTPPRYEAGRWTRNLRPDGQYALGLFSDFAEILGHFINAFAHLEWSMADLFACFIDDSSGQIAQPVWASIQSNRTRHQLMRTILREHMLAKDVNGDADQLLARFDKLIVTRNEFVHGLWQTHTDANTVYLTPRIRANGDMWMFQEQRIVELDELKAAWREAEKLNTDAQMWRGRFWATKFEAEVDA